MKTRFKGLFSLWLVVIMICSMTVQAAEYTLAGADAGYELQAEGAGADLAADGDTTVDGNVTLTYDIWYGQEKNEVTVGKGETVDVIANPTREGYTFAGWAHLINDGNVSYYEYGDKITVNENITLEARWMETYVSKKDDPLKNYDYITVPSEEIGTVETPLGSKFTKNEAIMSAIKTKTPVGHRLTGWKLWPAETATGSIVVRDDEVYGPKAQNIEKDEKITLDVWKEIPSYIYRALIEPIWGLKYKIDPQPLAEKPVAGGMVYDEENGWIKTDDAGVDVEYQWYEVTYEDVSYPVVDYSIEPDDKHINGSAYLGDYNSDSKSWKAVEYYADTYNIDCTFNVQKGDVVRVELVEGSSQSVERYYYDDNYDIQTAAFTSGTDGSYTYEAEQDIESFNLIIGDAEYFTAKITVIRETAIYTSLGSEQTESELDLDAIISGTYACELTFDPEGDGIDLLSDSVSYEAFKVSYDFGSEYTPDNLDYYKEASYRKGAEVKAKDAPVRNDYRLSYWSGSDGKMYEPGEVIASDSDIILRPVWDKITYYTVKYDLNAPELGESDEYKDVTVEKGTTTEIKAAPDRGDKYVFNGWSSSDDNTYEAGKSYPINNDITLTAQWLRKYTLAYDLNAPELDSSDYGDVTVVEGEKVEIKLPARDGYKFNGWASSDGKTYEPGVKYEIDGDITLTAQWLEEYTVSYDLNGGTGASDVSYADEIFTQKSQTTAKAAPERNNYTFDGWLGSDGRTYMPGDTLEIVGSIVLAAQWTRNSGGGGYSAPVGNVILTKVDAEDGTAVLANVEFKLYRSNGTLIGTHITDAKGQISLARLQTGKYYWIETRSADGYELDSSKHEFEINRSKTTEITVTNKRSKLPDVFTEEHFAYIEGYPDALVRPEANITRAETATVFYRLLNEETRAKYTPASGRLSDVEPGDWFYSAVSTIAQMGIVKGHETGKFAPDESITRAEFAAIAARFDTNESSAGSAVFSDISDHWARDEIAKAVSNGWVRGYEDGTFRPEQHITRAEAISLINRVLQRLPENGDDLSEGMAEWKDNSDPEKWYYIAIQEATNGHEYARKDNGYEYWTSLSSKE